MYTAHVYNGRLVSCGKKENLSFASACVGLENVMVNERSKALQKNNTWSHVHVVFGED